VAASPETVALAARVAEALARIAEEIGSGRPDVCGSRFVELEAWELAWAGAPAVVGGELNPAELVERLLSRLAPLVATVNAQTRRPRSALWRGAGDRLAQALMLAGETAGDPQAGEEAARRALEVPGPMSGSFRVAEVALDGAVERVQLRNGCCLWSKIPGEPKCSVCPLLPEAERAERRRAERVEA